MGGMEISFDIPEFSLESFLRTPNVDEFIKKSYHAAAKKIAREVEAEKNGSVKADLSSFETIIARSLNFTKEDIKEWLGTRDWTRINSYKDSQTIRRSLEKHLPDLASRINHLPKELSKKVAEKIIAELADKSDPIADFLFSTLTVERPSGSDDLSKALGF